MHLGNAEHHGWHFLQNTEVCRGLKTSPRTRPPRGEVDIESTKDGLNDAQNPQEGRAEVSCPDFKRAESAEVRGR